MFEIKETEKVFTGSSPTKYICQLPEGEIAAIKAALTSALLRELDCDIDSEEFAEALERGMDGRLCDLEDIIEIEYLNG